MLSSASCESRRHFWQCLMRRSLKGMCQFDNYYMGSQQVLAYQSFRVKQGLSCLLPNLNPPYHTPFLSLIIKTANPLQLFKMIQQTFSYYYKCEGELSGKGMDGLEKGFVSVCHFLIRSLQLEFNANVYEVETKIQSQSLMGSQLLDVLGSNGMWQSSYDPFMQQGFFWGYSCHWVPFQTSLYQTKEFSIAVRPQDGTPVHGLADFVFILDWRNAWRAILCKEFFPSLRTFQKGQKRQPQQLNEHKHLLILIFARKKWYSRVKLHEDAAKGPYIDGSRILDSQYDLRSSVETALDISIYLPAIETATANVDYLDSTLVLFLQQDILRFKVAVNDAEFLEEMKGLQDLDSKATDKIQGKACEVGFFDEFIKVLAEYLKLEASMPSKYERPLESNNIVPQFGVMKDGSLEYFYLHACLHCKFLLILDDLESYMLFFLVIICFEHLTKRPAPQNRHYLILIGYCVSNCYLRIALAIRKISQTTHPPRSHIEKLILLAFLPLKRCKFLLEGASWRFLDSRLSLSQLFRYPNPLIFIAEVVIAFGRDLLAVSSTTDEDLVDTLLVD